MLTKRILSTGFVCGAICCIPALAQTPAGTATAGDKDFITFAAQTDMTEAHFGQLAQDQSSDQDVKDYGQTLVTDHTKDYNTVTALATKLGADVPKGIDAAHNKMIDPVAKLKGHTFDRRFLGDMVKGHEQAIAKYKKEADSGDNADLKAYATATLPTLQMHLQKAEELAHPGKAKKTKM
jgi:putative membrane protein